MIKALGGGIPPSTIALRRAPDRTPPRQGSGRDLMMVPPLLRSWPLRPFDLSFGLTELANNIEISDHPVIFLLSCTRRVGHLFCCGQNSITLPVSQPTGDIFTRSNPLIFCVRSLWLCLLACGHNLLVLCKEFIFLGHETCYLLSFGFLRIIYQIKMVAFWVLQIRCHLSAKLPAVILSPCCEFPPFILRVSPGSVGLDDTLPTHVVLSHMSEGIGENGFFHVG